MSETAPHVPNQSSGTDTGQLFQFFTYLGICGYLIWIAVTNDSNTAAAEELEQVVFADFFGYFLLSFLFSGESKAVSLKRPIPFDMVLRVVGYLLLTLVFGWFMEGITGWPIAIVWMLGILASLSNVAGLRVNAIVRVVWAIVSAFLVGLVALIAGVDDEALFTTHLPTLLAWGLLYFGGVAVFCIFRWLASLAGER